MVFFWLIVAWLVFIAATVLVDVNSDAIFRIIDRLSDD